MIGQDRKNVKNYMGGSLLRLIKDRLDDYFHFTKKAPLILQRL